VVEVILRQDEHGVLAIGQASHAWMSGQLARAWGNSRFGPVEPSEEVCLGAEQHDVGMAQWDLAPTVNPDTGLPHSFIEMPLAVRIALWREGPRRLVSQSRYAALLAAMHGRRLYERIKPAELAPESAAIVRSFLADSREFEGQLVASLTADPATASFADTELVARNSQLVWTWDLLSLALCLGWAPRVAHDVPTADGRIDLQLDTGQRPFQLSLDPWPFRSPTLTVRCEGRRIAGRFDSDASLREGLAQAPWATIEFQFVPASSRQCN
jgi:Protein of unknown function (DUF3891)